MKNHHYIRATVFAVLLSACSQEHSLPDHKGQFLGELEPTKAKVGFADFAPNYYPNEDNAPVLVDGKKCNYYIFAHADSDIVYNLPKGTKRFTAIGIKPSKDKGIAGTFAFEVLLDGKSVFKSKALRLYPNYQVPISVDIPPEAQTLELKIDSLGNNFADHSIWAFPFLE